MAETYKTYCKCGNEINIEYEIGETKELTCENCGAKIKFISKPEGVYVYFG